MFVTKPGFEDPTAQFLGDPGSTYWRVVELTTSQAWYLLTYNVISTEGGFMRQTIAIAWESTLSDVIASLTPHSLHGLFVIRVADTPHANWTLREVETLWAPAASEEGETGPLLFSFKGDPRIYNSFFDVIDVSVAGRRRSHSFAPSP